MISTLSFKYKILLGSLLGIILVVGVGTYLGYSLLLGAPTHDNTVERFIVPLKTSQEDISQKLEEDGFIKNVWAFSRIHPQNITPGAYKIAKNMDAFTISKILSQEPYMKWIVIPEGLRKEEIATILADTLGWSVDEKTVWVTIDTAMDFDHTEGVYFPDTYLIPTDESPLDVAQRLRAKFEEVFATYSDEALNQNIKWTTVVKLASIVQREAAGKSDMPLVAGILWNRLLSNMKLEVDATIQYIKGDDNGWWPKIMTADKQIDSPYNTYKYTGLPPHPIANPGLEAIKAVLSPETTICLYYLHDSSGNIHCSDTYEGHLQNIQTYL
jgi:UPF0755 protein